MKIQSFVKDQYRLIPIEVEVSCVNGSHDFGILGQPDNLIKEVKNKIFSAFRSCGFDIPLSKKIYINLRPNHIKKSSLGLDLPIALGILWETGQLPLPQEEVPVVYGELGLDGQLYQPMDIDYLSPSDLASRLLWTGKGDFALGFARLEADSLRGLGTAQRVEAQAALQAQDFPGPEPIYISEDLGKLMAAIAIGEHSALFAGPKGSGKSTVVENLARAVGGISPQEFSLLRQIGKYFGEDRKYRPIVSPHHSSTEISMIGGGAKAGPGEFTRAHGGTLILDEFLEFSPRVQEALREPMENHCIHVARANGRRKHPAKFLLLATTNLCPCGDYYPAQKNRCVCRPSLRSRYVERLSGPVLDRFQIFYYAKDVREEEEVYLPELFARIRDCQKNYADQKLSRDYSLQELELKMNPSLLASKNTYFSRISRRRKLASFQLALSFSRWAGRSEILEEDIDLAFQYTVKSFEQFRWAASKEI